MSSLFDFGKPPLYAVMGNPVNHSKSPRIHGLFSSQTNQPINYIAIQVDPGGFEQAVRQFVANGGKGLNVTLPYKHQAWELVDERSPRARLAGAVNTILVQAGSLRGDNTDGAGLVTDLVDNHGYRLTGKRLLIMGAGGAARGVLGPLLEQGPGELTLVNRTVDRAVELAAHFAALGSIKACGFEALADLQFDLIINATSASLHGEIPPLPDTALAPEAWCYDMMYGRVPTVFLNWAHARGAVRVLDGLGMLVEQAAESYWLWRGRRPDTAPVIGQLRNEMTPP